MLILTPDNTTISIDHMPNCVDTYYSILDYEDPNEADFRFARLIYVESTSKPAVDLQVGPYRTIMPLDWSIIISDKHLGLVEVLELKSLNDREFDAFVMNPITSSRPEFLEITVHNIFPDFAWTTPKIHSSHILGVPLHEGENPLCAFFVKESHKIPESLDIGKIL